MIDEIHTNDFVQMLAVQQKTFFVLTKKTKKKKR